MTARSVITPTRNFYKPHPDPMDQLVQDLEMLGQHSRNHVEGGFVEAPTTPSSQGTGTLGFTDLRVDVGAGLAIVTAGALSFDAQVDFSVGSGSGLLYVGYALITVIVAKSVGGSVSLQAVRGSAAVSGTQETPSDADIQTTVGAGSAWIRLGDTTCTRVSDVVIAQTYDNSVRPLLGVNIDSAFGDYTFIETYLTSKLKK
jgi:hypothetical protein